MKTSGAILSACIALLLAPAMSASAEPRLLVDVQSGTVLAREDAFRRWYPASLTKLMSIYVVLRAVESGEITLKSPVKLSKAAAAQPPSKMFWGPGTVLNFDNALKIMAVKSANDVTMAVAESLAGSVEAFAARMNTEAARLGMTDTRFVNANGLHSPGQYTTARDLALLAVALRRDFPQHAHYFAYEGISYSKEDFTNYNILLGRFSGADGMKTGFVCASGFNLVGSATRDGRTLVAVVLGAKSQQERAEIAADLMADGFAGKFGAGEDLVTIAPQPGEKDPRDMRSSVCTEQAQSERWDGREVEGYITFNTPNIQPLTRKPEFVRVAIGDATGPLAPEGARLFLADVPVPTPRPVREPVDPSMTQASAALSDGAADAGETGLRPTLGIPLPTPRAAAVN